MKKHLSVLFSLCVILSGYAQTETRVAKTIRGKVVNSATNEAVSYTNIGIEDTFYGTASDENGNFQLKIPEEMVSKRITFSSVGFKSEIIPVKSLFNKEFNIIKLQPHTYDIEKIDVAAQSRVLTRILRMASENTPYNFISGPFNLVGSYKNEKIIDDSLHVENAKVLIYDRTGYREPSKTNAFRMRKYTIQKNEPDYSFATGFTNFDELLELDWVRNASSVLNPSVNHLFELTLEGEPVIDGNPAWVISFKQTRPNLAGSQDFHATEFQGKITILKDDYSVKKIEGSAKSTKHNRQGKSLAVGNSNANYFEDVSYDFAVTYSKLKPDILSLNKTYRYNGHQIVERSQLNITGVQIQNVQEIANRDYFVD
jgi:hypothetical protein